MNRLRVRVRAEKQLPRERRGSPIWQRAILCYRLGAAFRSLQMHHHHCRCITLSIAAQHNTNEHCLILHLTMQQGAGAIMDMLYTREPWR